MTDLGMIALSIVGTLLLTSLYGILATALRKRITVRSPESKIIEQLVPAVNALLETNSPMMQGIIAILEAQKGQYNDNVDDALDVNRKAKNDFDAYLRGCARVDCGDWRI